MKKTKPIALFIGRFQPFHKGHLSALKWIAARCSKVIVAIGSAEKANEPKNPFSAAERKKMIATQLAAAGLERKCIIVSVTDVNDNEKWVAHVDRSVPDYSVAYSNNLLVKRLMKEAGKTVRTVPFFKKGTFNATKIRGRMKMRKEWHTRVPKKIGEMLGKMKAEERIRKL